MQKPSFSFSPAAATAGSFTAKAPVKLATKTAGRSTKQSRWKRWSASDSVQALTFLAAHVPLALAFSASSAFAMGWIVLALSVGIWYALANPHLERVAYVAAYFIGSEVLWRMTSANPFWETGKYAIALLFFLALLRTGKLTGPMGIFLYFICLLPSLVLPMANVSNESFLGDISYYFSGPLALTVSTWFFSHVKLDSTKLQRLFCCLIAPVVGIGTITLFKLVTAKTVVFTNSSNFATSGGFGPNQVSAALGLGALVAFLAGMMSSGGRAFKVVSFLIALFLSTMSALTFSRTGLYTAAVVSVIAIFFLIREPRLRLQLIAGLGVVLLGAYFLVLPRLENMTEGKLGRRFANTTLTGRDRIALGDIQLFFENPVFGIGPGQARDKRTTDVGTTAAHTEFSRLLAEHGSFGLVAVLMLLLTAFHNFRRTRSPEAQALTVSAIAWSFLFMSVSAMRLAAPAFMFGLSAVTLLPLAAAAKTSSTPQRSGPRPVPTPAAPPPDDFVEGTLVTDETPETTQPTAPAAGTSHQAEAETDVLPRAVNE